MNASNRQYDAIVIGGGHNGLVNGAYLAKAGLRTLVLEQRHLVGGAAITEELVPGFSFTTTGTPDDADRSSMDPFDLLAAMAERDERRLDPGVVPVAEALLARIVSDPVVVPIGRRTRRRIVAAVAAVAVVGAGTAAAAVLSREPADAVAPGQVACLMDGDLVVGHGTIV